MTQPAFSTAVAHPFHFLRHGETTWNASKRTQGQLDTPLNETGHAQAQRAAETIAPLPISRIVASPLSRVADTARPVAEALGVDLEFDDGLKECHLGAMQGQDHGPWLSEYWQGTFTPEGGEPFPVFAERVWSTVSRLVDREGVLLVAHGGIWRAMLEFVDIEPAFWMPNAIPIAVSPGAGAWQAEPLLPLPADPRPMAATKAAPKRSVVSDRTGRDGSAV